MSGRPREVLWLTVGPTACGSYRCHAPSLSLDATGRYRSRLINAAAGPGPTGRQMDIAARADVIVLQRNLTPSGTAWWTACRALGKPLLYDIDDDLFAVPEDHPYAERFGGADARQRLTQFIEEADGVLVSSVPLQASIVAARGGSVDHVHVLQNHLHPAIWPRVGAHTRSTGDDDVVIGWQGSPTHAGDLGEIAPALDRVLAEFPGARVRFFGDLPPSVKARLPAGRVDELPPVQFRDFPRALAEAGLSIGLAPLRPLPFNNAKSNIKWLEYSACKIPTIASASPAYADIEHGVTGWIAGTSEEWLTALRTLIADRSLRADLAARAHDTVWRDWSEERRAPAWVDVLDQYGSTLAWAR